MKFKKPGWLLTTTKTRKTWPKKHPLDLVTIERFWKSNNANATKILKRKSELLTIPRLTLVKNMLLT